MKLNYKGFVISQSSFNNHISVYKDNKLVLHFSVDRKFTVNDLKSLVDFYLTD